MYQRVGGGVGTKKVEGPKPLRLVPWVVAVPVHASFTLVTEHCLKQCQFRWLTACRAGFQWFDWYRDAFFVENDVAIVIVVVFSVPSSGATLAIAPVLVAAIALALAHLAHLGTVVLIVEDRIVRESTQEVFSLVARLLMLVID